MKIVITIFFILSSFISVYSCNELFAKENIYKFYKEYYSSDIDSFKESENSVSEIFNQCYIGNNFEFDFKIALYSLFINNTLPDISIYQKVSLVVFMMKQDLKKDNIAFYKKEESNLSHTFLIDLASKSIKLMKDVVFVESKEEMITKENSYNYQNEYYVPKGCYDITVDFIKKYKKI